MSGSEKPIRINLELEADVLDRLGGVLDKLRLILEAGGEGTGHGKQETSLPAESGENTLFDPTRFAALAESPAVQAAAALSAEAESLPIPFFQQMEDIRRAQGQVGQSPPPPPSAGFEVQGGNAFDPQRITLQERLVTAGPAPLTAEAVSRAFCRDDRRYDNGFPLY